MPVASRVLSNSLAKDSRVIFGNHAGANLRVASAPSATVITVSDAGALTGTALYAASSPGQVIVKSCAAGTTHHGKMADVTGITGAALTVDVDFSLILAAGDIVACVPPLSVELFLNQGHTLNVRNNSDFTKGLGQTFDIDNTPMTVDVDGDIPFFQIPTSEGLTRILAFAVGSYKTTAAGTHKYRPLQANDGTFANSEDATVYTQDGNGVVRQVFYGLFATRLVLEVPEGGLATGSVSVLGSGSAREIGGSGKLFTTGANNYVRANFVCDTGPRLSFRAAFVELGGSFDAGLTSATMTTVKNITITIERGAISDRTLGDGYIVKPEEETFTITVSGRRILQDDSVYESAHGQTTDAEPGFKATTRMLVKLISLADATKTLTIDIPNGVFSGHIINRQPGRFTEEFTYTSLATLDGTTNCVSTAVPPVQITLVSGVADDVLSAL